MKRTMMAACILSLVACGGSKDDVATDQRDDWAARQASLVYSFPDNQQQQVPVPAPVVLRFSSPVAETAPNIRIREAGGSYISDSDIQLEWVDGKRGLILTPDSKLKPLTQYQVEVPAIELERGTAAARTIQFTTRGLYEGPKSLVAEDNFKVIRTIPDGTNFPIMDFSSFRVQFSQPLDRTTVRYGNGAEDTLRMMGPDGLVEAHVLVSGHYLTVDPKEDLKPGAEYRLELTKSITSTYGDALPAEGSLDNPNNPIAQRLTVTPQDTTSPTTGLRVSMVQDIADTGELSPLTGQPINLVPMASVLLGEDTATQASGTIAAELAFVPNFPDVTPFRVKRGSLIEGASIEVLIGGQVPAGFESGKVRMDFLSDATGYLLPNPYSNADDAARQVRLFMDVAVSTETPAANGAITQDLLHIELVGTSIVEDGLMVINAVGVVEPNVLGSERATGVLSFYMKAYEDQDNPPAKPEDNTGPVLQSWTLGMDEMTGENKALLANPGDPITLNFNKAIDSESVKDNVHLFDGAGNKMEIDYYVDGAAIVIKPKTIREGNDFGIKDAVIASLSLNREENPSYFRVVVNQATDIQGNISPVVPLDMIFSLATRVDNANLVETSMPLGVPPSLALVEMRETARAPIVIAAYPGYPCALLQSYYDDTGTGAKDQDRDIRSGKSGLCSGGHPGISEGQALDAHPKDDVIPVLSLPSNWPIVLSFSKEINPDSVVLGKTFSVKKIDDEENIIGDVRGRVEIDGSKVIFFPEDKWEVNEYYKYSVLSSGYAVCSQGRIEKIFPDATACASAAIIIDNSSYSCGEDSVCDFDGLPLQTQPFGTISIGRINMDGSPTGNKRDFYTLQTGAEPQAGGPDFEHTFIGGPPSKSVLQILSTQPIADTNKNQMSERSTIGTSTNGAVNHMVGEFLFEQEEYGPGAPLDSAAPGYYEQYDPGSLSPAMNSAKILSRFRNPEREADLDQLGVLGTNVGCGYTFDAPPLPNMNAPRQCPEHKFTYLLSSLVAEVTDTVTEEGVMVRMWPGVVVGTAIDLHNNFSGILPVTGSSGVQLLRMRYAGSNRNEPIIGWIKDSEVGGPKLSVELDLYVDVPFALEWSGIGVNNIVNMRSYPIKMSLEGGVDFLQDGRMRVEQFNTNLVDITMELYAANNGRRNGFADLFIPEFGSRLNYISSPIK